VRALVTGGAGFIGSNLVDALLDAGHEVTVVDNLARGVRDQVRPEARFVRLDVADPSLSGVIARAQPDAVFHLAAQIDVRRSMREPLFDANANVLGTVNVLDACRTAGVRRVVFASTGGAVYGDTDTLPTPENHPLLPASAYGAAKVSAEMYGEMFQRGGGPEFVALRYGNVYGPRQDPHGEAGVVAIFAQRLLGGEQTVINGDGRQTRDYVFVDDVVRANVLALASTALGPFNVGTEIETDVNELHSRLSAICGSADEPIHGAAKPGEQRRSALDTERARTLLGWTAITSLDEGLRRTVDHFRAG